MDLVYKCQHNDCFLKVLLQYIFWLMRYFVNKKTQQRVNFQYMYVGFKHIHCSIKFSQNVGDQSQLLLH